VTLSYDLRENLREGSILPEQFFPPVHFKNQYRGETALLYAILEDAVRCLQEGGQEKRWRNQRRMAQEAEAWLFVDDYEWPFSFVNICDQLGLDPTYLRRGLEDLRSQRRSVPEHKNSPCSPLESFLRNSPSCKAPANFTPPALAQHEATKIGFNRKRKVDKSPG
jgi:hypothetical protein